MDYTTKSHLLLPFSGSWFVSNGGRTAETNNHMRFADGSGPQNQLYAYDFRFPSTGNEKTLDEYKAFGQDVLSPAEGAVIQIIDGAIDVLPGERDRGVGVGNTVVLDFGAGKFGVLCHFRYGSIRVKVGDIVRPGDILGSCGNTGNTSEPHIHFNLQDGPRMHLAHALPAQFEGIYVDGVKKTAYEPVRHEWVSNTP